MPTGEVPISETATTPPGTGKKPSTHATTAKPSRGGFRPMAAIRTTIRNAPWVVIAVVLHVILIVWLSIVYVKSNKEKDKEGPTAIGLTKSKPVEDTEPAAEPEAVIDRNSVPKPRNDVDAELVSTDVPDAVLPTNQAEDLSKEVGTPGDDSEPSAPSGGTAIGVGAGGGHFGTGRPSAFVSRTAAKEGSGGGNGRLPSGATVKTEEAVKDGLIWLVRHQQADGSWAADRMKEVCDVKDGNGPCCQDSKLEVTAQYNEGLTGLALLSFLGQGFDHTSKIFCVDTHRKKKTRFGEVVKKGLEWLKARQAAHPDGRFTDNGQIYNESLATLAMCEAYGMTGHRAWKDSAQKGVDFLIKAQRLNPNGTGLWGWRYEPRDWFESKEAIDAIPDEKDRRIQSHQADISASAWVVMALKSAEISGLTVPHEAFKGAMDFAKFVTVKDRGVAYMDPLQVGRKLAGEGDNYMFHPTTLHALGMCIRTFAEKDIEDPVLEWSAKQLAGDLPAVSKDKLSVDYYYWYYGTLALNQFDGPASPKQNGKYWKAWDRALGEVLLPLQDDGKTCAKGSWPTSDRWSLVGGPIYRTAINVLTLEVYYRYENAFAAAALRKRDVKDAPGSDGIEKK